MAGGCWDGCGAMEERCGALDCGALDCGALGCGAIEEGRGGMESCVDAMATRRRGLTTGATRGAAGDDVVSGGGAGAS